MEGEWKIERWINSNAHTQICPAIRPYNCLYVDEKWERDAHHCSTFVIELHCRLIAKYGGKFMGTLVKINMVISLPLDFDVHTFCLFQQRLLFLLLLLLFYRVVCSIEAILFHCIIISKCLKWWAWAKTNWERERERLRKQMQIERSLTGDRFSGLLQLLEQCMNDVLTLSIIYGTVQFQQRTKMQIYCVNVAAELHQHVEFSEFNWTAGR